MRSRLLFESPIGLLTVTEEHDRITELSFGAVSGGTPLCETPLLLRAREQLGEYFSGTRRVFSLPIALGGTPFMQDVLRALLRIPYGETCSYAALAASAGHPGAARAAGGACHRNPLPIIIPCHRVLAADGSLHGYGGGTDKKAILLRTEGVKVK